MRLNASRLVTTFFTLLKAGLRAAACGGRPRPPTTGASRLTRTYSGRSITPLVEGAFSVEGVK